MKSRNLKFHLLLCFMVVLFAGYLGFSLYLYPHSGSGAYVGEVVVPEPPNIDADVSGGESAPAPEETKPTIPTGAISLIKYAIDLYNNGDGSLSYGTYVISNKGRLPNDFFVPGLGGLTVSGTQYASFRTVRNGQSESLEESYFYYNVEPLLEGLLVGNGLLRFGYRGINVDENANQVVTIETNATKINKGDANCSNWKHDLMDASATKSVMNIPQGLDRYKVIYSREFPVEINDKNCRVISRNNLKDPQYSYITISYDVSKLPPELSYYYKANGGLQNVTYTSYTFEFKISRKTGRLSQVVRREKFTSYALGDMVEINSEATFVQTFQQMDKSQNVPHIYDEWKK